MAYDNIDPEQQAALQDMINGAVQVNTWHELDCKVRVQPRQDNQKGQAERNIMISICANPEEREQEAKVWFTIFVRIANGKGNQANRLDNLEQELASLNGQFATIHIKGMPRASLDKKTDKPNGNYNAWDILFPSEWKEKRGLNTLAVTEEVFF